jgi:hypothetical protein
MTYEEWRAEAVKRFGPDPMNWKFKCPSCGYVASAADWKNAGDEKGTMIAFSCLGRLTGSKKEIFDKTGGPCNYAGGGLFGLNPVEVEQDGRTHRLFDFAHAETPKEVVGE